VKKTVGFHLDDGLFVELVRDADYDDRDSEREAASG
jgi:hypothetical protein